MWFVAAAWMGLALLLATVIGRAVRIADDDAELVTEMNFVVDSNPLEAFAGSAGPGVPGPR
ncbi:hypothetical protein DQ237_10330 [Blastococcus sp. TF02-8]|nr:hypothetical protein DQ237_10330 [Blastococcus sp. TF02-8]